MIMASSSMQSLKSPFEILQMLPEGHEKALKQAFYNTAALVFVIIVFIMAVAVYHVMSPFLRPLLWALLCGSAIHPFKRRLTLLLRGWLNDLSDNSTPLLIGSFMLPIKIFDRSSENCADFFLHYIKKIVGISTVCFSLYLLFHFLPPSFFTFSFNLGDAIIALLNNVIEVSSSTRYLTGSLLFGYLLLVWFWWNPQSEKPLTWLSSVVWLGVACSLASVTGPLALPIMLCLVTLLSAGLGLELHHKHFHGIQDSTDGAESGTTFLDRIRSIFMTSDHLEPESPPSKRKCSDSSLPTTEESPSDTPSSCYPHQKVQALQVDPPTPQSSTSAPKKPSSVPFKRRRKIFGKPHKMSTLYLSGVVWACILAELFHHLWLLYLLCIPVGYIIIKRAGYHFSVWHLLSMWFKRTVGEWYQTRKHVLVPPPVRGLWKILTYVDAKVRSTLEKCVDTFTSIGVILLLLVVTVLGTIFMSIQVYGESVHIVEVTGSVINRTLIFPDNFKDINDMLDNMVGDAYLYGRQWISRSVQHAIDDKNEHRAVLVEKQLLELWDEAYRLWVSRNLNESYPAEKRGMPSFNNLVEGVKNLDLDLLVNFVKENIGTFMSVVESVWAVLKGNITLALHVLTSSVSLVFGGGSAVLNFILSIVIFSTALFYLLCASGEDYMPSALVSKMVPQSDAGLKFADAVEEAVNGVFAASFKMAAFYGLYTWFIHTLFEVRIIYIPSVMAALFGAVPFLGAYWACLPAVLELWLEQGQGTYALLMLACQYTPALFVDSTIYSEIKGAGHPYLTGLAIAGGVFYMGVEGALFGPLLLCFLFVVANMYTTVMQDSAGSLTSVWRPRYNFRRMLTID